MNPKLSSIDDSENQQLNEDLYLKYNLQEMNAEVLIQKYPQASKNMKKLIRNIFKERGFNQNEIEVLFIRLK
ncbi:TPA: hypothetical protein PGG10_003919 [Acinetobacter nosocomialis]|jgi:hypothetical protein|uniref:hypothetical protein n=1 Tax=Acinetobacter TaxID=469 RepID=UPI001F4C3792|nr:hypothetical protein [Acinetobacter nosocomialis]HDG9824818.1 hypothetical protein [Acinetobacter nosocomialis]